jgi:uncharacterized membrane protein
MSKADVFLFGIRIAAFMLTALLYGWPVLTLVMWVRWWLRREDYNEQIEHGAFIQAILLTTILVIGVGYAWWISLPDTGPSVNAR